MTGMTPDDTVWRLVPGLSIGGAFNGIVNAALGRQAITSVPADRAAMGSGANNTARYVGSAVGITVLALIVNRAGYLDAAGTVAGWNLAALITAVFSAVGAAVVMLTPSSGQSA